MAVRGPDPHNLRRMAERAAPQTAPIIQTDLECIECGYNLRGLRLGVNCPECGTSTIKQPEVDDPLSLMPRGVIVSFIRGCWVASICVLLMVAGILAERFGALRADIVLPALAGLSVLWALSVVWLTPGFSLPQARSRGFGMRSRTRAVARWLQLGWVVGLGAAAVEAVVTNPSAALTSLLSTLVWVGIVVGLTGLIVLSVLLERLSEWTRDEDAQRMFNWAAWSWPIAVLLYIPVASFIGGWLGGGGRYRLDFVVVLLWVAAIATFPYGLLLLAKSVTLSFLHSIEHHSRMERREERAAEYQRQVAESVRKMDAKERQ